MEIVGAVLFPAGVCVSSLEGEAGQMTPASPFVLGEFSQGSCPSSTYYEISKQISLLCNPGVFHTAALSCVSAGLFVVLCL